MFRKSLLLILLMALFSCQKKEVQTYPFLWKVTGTDHSQNYILGIPGFAPKDFKADSIVLKRFTESDWIIFEIDQENFAMHQQFLFNEKGYYPPETDWESKFSEETIQALQNRLEELDWSLGHMPRMQPWLLDQTLYHLELAQNHYQSHFIATDFYEKAKNKKTTGLIEELSVQHIKAAMEENEQIALLENHLHGTINSSLLKDYHEAYLQQNENKTDSLVNRYLNSLSPYAYQKLVQERNATLAEPLISTLQKEGNKLFILNLGNLLGEDGILKKIEEAGYQVKQESF